VSGAGVSLAARPSGGALRQPWRRSLRRNLAGYLFILPALAFLFVLIVYPILLTFQLSTNAVTQDLSTRWIGFSNYLALLKDGVFFDSVRITAGFTAMTVVLHLIVGFALALVLHREWPSRKARNFVRGLLILPWLFSPAASALMWSLLLHPFGTFNFVARAWLGAPAPIEWLSSIPLALISITVVNLWRSYPFYMVIILGGLQSIPPDLYEAARVDGASFWQSLRSITMPMLRPIVVALSVIDIIGTVAQYDLFRLLTDGGPRRSTETVAYYLWKVAFMDGKLDYASTISIVLLIGLTIFIAIYLKLASRGQTADADGTAF
jgi:multiple sugar transport system permease protein